ncbi:hypothetical protein ISS06_01345 [Patescibacteria group bacterium]|nr:hypothetical protein [Patescibacteria group bacterium]
MKKNIIVIILIIILIIVGIIFMFASQNEQDIPTDDKILKQQDIEKQEQEKAKAAQIKIIKTDLKNQARAFVQYMGTYSKENAYQNREELLNQMTDSFIKKSLEQIEQNINQPDFASLLTSVLSVEARRHNNEVAVYSVNVKQTRVFASVVEDEIEYKTGEILWLKQADKWKVNSIDFDL